jgi:hypothetical protein
MTSRERWTVYPLLFLSLGITLKDKVTKEITTERVNCRSMVVTDREGKPQISLASTPTGGSVRIPSPRGTMWMLGNAGSLSGILFIDSRGKVIQPTPMSPLFIPPERPRGEQPNEPSHDRRGETSEKRDAPESPEANPTEP